MLSDRASARSSSFTGSCALTLGFVTRPCFVMLFPPLTFCNTDMLRGALGFFGFGVSATALLFCLVSGSHAPNNSFKPTPCPGFVETSRSCAQYWLPHCRGRRGLTQALGAMRKIVAIVLACSSLTACVGDGVVRVSGRLASESAASLGTCQLQLVVPSSEISDYYETDIDPIQFSESFTVAPRDETYPLVITCAGHEPYHGTVRYVPGGHDTAQLGSITLRVQQNGT